MSCVYRGLCLLRQHFVVGFLSGGLRVRAATFSCGWLSALLLELVPAPPQYISAAPHAADHFFLKRSGGQAVRGSQAVRSVTLVRPCRVRAWVWSCVGPFARWSALRMACVVLGWRVGVADFPRSRLRLPLAPSQHTSAAPHAADHFFLEWSGGQAVRGSEAVRSAVSCAAFLRRRVATTSRH
jgi:hypothetical protein